MVGKISLCLALAYLLGAIPTAYIVSRLVADVDIRHIGDGNPGALNTFRHVGRWAGIAVGVVDVAKGSLAVLVARRVGLDELWALIAGGLAVLGHDFTLFLRFQGGQGMAATIGVLLTILSWQTLLGLCIAGLARFLLRRSFDVSMALGLGAIPLLAWLTGRPLRLVLYPILLLPVIGLRKLVQMHAAGEVATTVNRRYGD